MVDPWDATGVVRKLDVAIDGFEGNAFDRVPVISPDGHRAAGLTFSAPRPVARVPRQEGFSAAGHDYIALILNWPEELRRLEASGVGR